MTFFYKFCKKARVYYTLSISRGGAQAPGPPLDSPLAKETLLTSDSDTSDRLIIINILDYDLVILQSALITVIIN